MQLSYDMSNAAQFEKDGFFVQPGVLSDLDCDRIVAELAVEAPSGVGTRNMLALPWCAALAKLLGQHPRLSAFVRARSVAVQCTLFAKSPDANWSVTPHQDLSIPVAFKVDATCCSGWSEKEGEIFTQPSVSVLDMCIAIRLHLDECGPEAGPLTVAPGSHKLGRLPNSAVPQLFASRAHNVCTVPRGGALLMRPLLIHASSKAAAPVNRRVLHFLYGPPTLPLGLEWAHAV